MIIVIINSFVSCLFNKFWNIKVGSPKLNPIISIPLFFNSLAFAAIARVAEAGKILFYQLKTPSSKLEI